MIIFGIVLTKTDFWLLGVCGAILLIWLKYRLAHILHRKSIAEDNINKFIRVFADFMLILDTKGALITTAKMKEMLSQHKRAEIELRNSLNWWGKRKFNCYWKQYRKKADKYYQAPAQLGFGKLNKEMLEAINKLIKKAKRL